MGKPAAGDGRLRASHGDREQVVEVLKAAFVQGRLTPDELDARVGQALAARAYADLAALIVVALKVESRHQNRSRGQLPPGPASRADDPASSGPPPSNPASRRPRRPPGLLAVGRAG
jgi:Domain of unknown function (DUF1707)